MLSSDQRRTAGENNPNGLDKWDSRCQRGGMIQLHPTPSPLASPVSFSPRATAIQSVDGVNFVYFRAGRTAPESISA